MLKNAQEILGPAAAKNYAVAAVNVGNSVEINAVIEAAEELCAPLILDVLPGNIRPCPAAFCTWIRTRCQASEIPLALNLDDEKSFEGARRAIQYGATSLMVNRSHLPFEENVAEVKKVVAIAHEECISVEAGPGAFGPENEYDERGLSPIAGAVRFIRETGADSLIAAICITDSLQRPEIDFRRLSLIKNAVGDCPLVLHGTFGIPDDQILAACAGGINKVNFSKELKAAALRAFADKSGENIFDSAKSGIKKRLQELIALTGSAGKGV